MPCYDFVCTNTECGKVTEKIVTSYDTETVPCSHCGAEARKPEMGFVAGSKRHVGTHINWISTQDSY